MPALIYGI